MKFLRTIVSELIGLFVDDGLFAAAVLGWVIVVALARSMGVPAPWRGAILLAGLAVILVESVARRARSS